MSKILVTGANGFLGYYLVQQLLAENFFVIASGRGPCRLPFQSSHLIYEELDFTNEDELGKIMELHQPEIVLHAGAMSKPDECELNQEAAFKTNLTGTEILLRYAASIKCFFIFVSTDFVFSGEKGMYREDDERGPVNYYGTTKMLAEDAVMKYPHDWSIVRTVLVYGKPHINRQNILTNTAAALRKGEKLRIFDDQVRTPTHVEDLTAGIRSIIQKKARGIFHISGEDVCTPYEMTVAVAHHLNLDASQIEKIKEGDLQAPAKRPLKTGFDISKAKTILDFHPVSFAEGLRKTFLE